jgi:putative ATPase
MDDLFETPAPKAAGRAPADARAVPGSEGGAPAPLADRMRPRTLDEVVGQAHLIGPGKVLRRAFEEDTLHSMILWGPPGTGKTTLALLLAQIAGARFATFSAVLSGVKEIRQVMAEAEADRARRGRRTILFVDEIHRFNKAQQDAFLPYVERGDIVLVGATTENPSFEVNAALLSRCRVYVLQPLGEDDLVGILARALADPERGLGGSGVTADEDALRIITRLASGDARSALNILELAVALEAARPDGRRHLTEGAIREAVQKKALLYDKSGEEHYNLISALHKSLRDSDPDGALYWLGRMLDAGEDPLYVARRLVRFASEDVGNADPAALRLTLDAKEAYHFLGTPEGELALAQATVYLALAPKSNAVYAAWNAVREDIREKPAEPVPLHLRNAPTGLMANLGYGRGYQYAHDAPDAVVDQEHLPGVLRGRVYYRPTERGLEKDLGERLRRWREQRATRTRSKSAD